MSQSDPLPAGPPPDTSSALDVAPRTAPQVSPSLSSAHASSSSSSSSPSSSPALSSSPEVDPDPEWTEYLAWVDRESAAGRHQEPGPEIWDPEAWAPGDPAPAVPVRPRFGQDDEADLLPPRPLLAGLTEEAVSDLGRLSDGELVGVLRATRRQIAREQYKAVLVTAEYARRQQAVFEDAARRGVPVGCRAGGFPGDELAVELVTTPIDAGRRIDDAIDLTSRLPMTLAGMAAGAIDEARAGWIATHTRCLSQQDAAYADEVLAAVAPDLRVDQLADRASRLAAKLDPEAVKARKERARRHEQRVETRREASGNASLSGREMDTADVIASKAFIDAVAARLRRGGIPGSLGALRVLAMADLTQGRDPLDRLNHPAAEDQPAEDHPTTDHPDDEPPPAGQPSGGAARPGPAPLPALVNLIIPAGTLLGWSTAAAQAGALGLLDPDDTRAVAQAAASHHRTRWCATLVGPDGTAIAHGCASGQPPACSTTRDPSRHQATRNPSHRRSSSSSSYCAASASPSPPSPGAPATTPTPKTTTPRADGSPTSSARATPPATPPAARHKRPTPT